MLREQAWPLGGVKCKTQLSFSLTQKPGEMTSGNAECFVASIPAISAN
jgi:hypothetical protein